MKKSVFWQSVRGLCMVAVIMMHCPNALKYNTSEWQFQFYFIGRQFINFPVAIFIFLAGYFVSKRATSDPKTYVKDRVIKRLIIPFSVWSCIYTLINFMQCLYTGTRFSWKWSLFRFIMGQSAPPLYYIAVLIQLTVLTPLLLKLVKKKNAVHYILWMITPIYLIFLYLIKLFILHENSFPYGTLYATLFPAWFGFYWLGICVKNDFKKWSDTMKKINGVGYAILFFTALLLSFLESVLLAKCRLGFEFALNQVRFGSFAYSIVLIFILISFEKYYRYSNNIVFQFLPKIGDASYGIYYVHMLYIYLYVFLLSKAGINNFYGIYYICMLICTMISSVFSVIAMKKVLKKDCLLIGIGMQ